MQNLQSKILVTIQAFILRQNIKKSLDQNGTLVVEQTCSAGGPIKGAGGNFRTILHVAKWPDL